MKLQMKLHKRISIILSLVVITLFSTSCGLSIRIEPQIDSDYSDNSGLNQQKSTVQLFDEEIYTNNGIEVYFSELTNSSFSFEVRNQREDTVYVVVNCAAINHCMIWDFVSPCDITPGNKMIQKYSLKGISDYGIKEVETVDVFLSFYAKQEAHLIDEAICHIDIASNPKNNFIPNFDSFRVYEDDFIEMDIEKKGNNVTDINAIFMNKTDEIISAYITNTSINGVMLSHDELLGFSFILPHCYAYTGIDTGMISVWSALDDEIEEKGLNPVSSYKGELRILFGGLADYGKRTNNLGEVVIVS